MSFGSTLGQGIQGMSGAAPFNPQVGIGPGGLPPGNADATQDPTPMIGQPGFQEPGSMPGMGGKGGMPGSGAPGMGGKGSGGPLSQIPIDMNGNVLGADQPPMPTPMPEPTSMGGLPPAPNAQSPLGKVSGGTPGRPSASAPMVPRGPGFANPGAPGNPPPQPPERGILTNPAGQPMPFQGGQQNRLQPARPAPAVRPVNPYRPAPTMAQPVNVARRGAGRGGMLR